MDAVLVATIGAEPQVITLATQALLARRAPLTAVVVLHTDATRPPLDSALPALITCFAAQFAWPPLTLLPIPIADVLTPAQIAAFAEALFQTLKEWVARGAAVHLLLAGGRKSMAMAGMSVAQLVLGPQDAVWVLYSDDALRQADRMVAGPGDVVELVPIALSPLGAAPPVFTRPFQAESVPAAHAALAAASQRQLAHFVAHELTPAEREVAGLVAREVLTVEQVAARLVKSKKTVTNQLNSVYSKLEAAFGLQPEVGVKREFLRRELGAWFGKDGS